MTDDMPPLADWEREGAVRALVERTWAELSGAQQAGPGRLTAVQQGIVDHMLRVLREAAGDAEAGCP